MPYCYLASLHKTKKAMGLADIIQTVKSINLKSTTLSLLKNAKALTWILSITFVVVGLPLVLEIEREQQLIQLEKQQQNPANSLYSQTG
eukprot:maker-scaffold_6-snap-gene-4.14-mRNA-1 protein AED:0.00 eAED:0.00 QI:52/1/1/1/1/1/2/67/88